MRTSIADLDPVDPVGDCVQSAMSDAAPAGTLRIQSVVDQVYAAVRGAILSGELQGGARLRQATLATQLGVSRTPLREALRRLATEGLVVLEANRGASVATHDLAGMRDAWLARLALEPGAARLAAERGDAPSLAAMRAAIAAQRADADDADRSFEANREFHLALVAAAGNPHLMRFAEMLWVPRIGVFIYRTQADDGGRVLGWADEHERILEAVSAGDSERADRLTREHIAASPPGGGHP
jgi:DNA-binding GntR family transcriptional regulator